MSNANTTFSSAILTTHTTESPDFLVYLIVFFSHFSSCLFAYKTDLLCLFFSKKTAMEMDINQTQAGTQDSNASIGVPPAPPPSLNKSQDAGA
jgi:hypothetical protein